LEPLLLRGPARSGRTPPSRHRQCAGQLRLEPLEGEVAVAGLGTGVLADRGHHRAELADDPCLLRVVQGERALDLEDSFDP